MKRLASLSMMFLLVGVGAASWADAQEMVAPVAVAPRVSDVYSKLPLYFEVNRGQVDPRVKFLARGPRQTLFLTKTEAVLVFRRPEQREQREGPKLTVNLETREQATGTVLRMTFAGASPTPRVTGLEELPGKANYFIGNEPAKWRTNVPTYARVQYPELYPGIDLIYYGTQRQLEYDFVVRPGANPNDIVLDVQGADRMAVTAQGDLVLHTAVGEIRWGRPVIYQDFNGIRREMAGGYVVKNSHQVGFRVAAYDRSQPLVIDPVLFYSTYLGGISDDFDRGIAVDAAGNAYVTGFTASINFPTTLGAFQTLSKGGNDAFVTKLNPTGSGLVYSTYLGGGGDDIGRGIAVDGNGNAYVTGDTTSVDFPTTPSAFRSASGTQGTRDAFVTRLDATGSALVYSTVLVGLADSADRRGIGIAVDGSGNAYVTGHTESRNFPTTPGAFQSVHGNTGTPFCSCIFDFDAFVAKVNTNASGAASLVYSSYLGGSTGDAGVGIAVDASGNMYVSGWTFSSNFPTTPGVLSGALHGLSDDFVAKINPNASGPASLVYSTYLGGSGSEAVFLNPDANPSIAVDAGGNAYVVGTTNSLDFPTTPGVVGPAFNGGASDAFVAKLNSSGTGLLYATYLGGADNDFGFGIAVDAAGNAYVTGATISTNFPTTPGAPQSTLGGDYDAFVTKLNSTATALVYSTYLGGNGLDRGERIAVDTLPNPNTYVLGHTASMNFPTTPGAFQTTFGGGGFDVFVAKIADVVLPPPPTVGKVTGGGTIDVVGGIGNFGFIVQRQAADGSIQGDLQYVNHASGANVHSVLLNSFVIVGNTATFGGTCTNKGAPCSFTVNVTDNGEPGFTDTFTISVSGGPTEGGTLRSGNIQIHQ